jgi:hypothetical protein
VRAPKLSDKFIEGSLVISKRWVVGWCRCNYGDALMHKLADAAEDGQGHVLSAGIECWYAITHARVGGEVTMVDLEFVFEFVRIHVVEVIALGD